MICNLFVQYSLTHSKALCWYGGENFLETCTSSHNWATQRVLLLMRTSQLSDDWLSSKTLKPMYSQRRKSGLWARVSGWGMVWALLPAGVFLGQDVAAQWSPLLCPGRRESLDWWFQGSFPEREGSTTWWLDLSKTNRRQASKSWAQCWAPCTGEQRQTMES